MFDDEKNSILMIFGALVLHKTKFLIRLLTLVVVDLEEKWI